MLPGDHMIENVREPSEHFRYAAILAATGSEPSDFQFNRRHHFTQAADGGFNEDIAFARRIISTSLAMSRSSSSVASSVVRVPSWAFSDSSTYRARSSEVNSRFKSRRAYSIGKSPTEGLSNRSNVECLAFMVGDYSKMPLKYRIFEQQHQQASPASLKRQLPVRCRVSEAARMRR
jgi:hypothetical protein